MPASRRAVPMHADQGSDRTDLVGILRAGLIAKLERVLRRPLIA